MRVTTGSAKGRTLQMVPGDSTRPITDRAKQALFNILGNSILGTRVLDLFGGTGAVGIEALSRGADFAQFVDLNRKAVDTIRTNLRNCRLEQSAQVTQGDSFAWLERYQGEAFDFVYVAPPQYQGLWSKVLLLLDGRPELLGLEATVVVQIHPREETPLELANLEEFDRRKYGSVLLLFYASAAEMEALRDEGRKPGRPRERTFQELLEMGEQEVDDFIDGATEREIVEYVLTLDGLDADEYEHIARKVRKGRDLDLWSLLTEEERADLKAGFAEMDTDE